MLAKISDPKIPKMFDTRHLFKNVTTAACNPWSVDKEPSGEHILDDREAPGAADRERRRTGPREKLF